MIGLICLTCVSLVAGGINTTWLTTTTDGQLFIEPSIQNRLRRVKDRDALLYGIDFRGVRSKGAPPWLYVYALGYA
jgi:hypothetical protein